MKDRTNKEKPLLEPTIKWLQSFANSIADLHQEVYPQSPMWFVTMAQGDIKQIRDLLDDIEWLMEDMVPKHLQEKDSFVEVSHQPEEIAVQKAA